MKWQKETDKLRQIALDCDLTEELKWACEPRQQLRWIRFFSGRADSRTCADQGRLQVAPHCVQLQSAGNAAAGCLALRCARIARCPRWSVRRDRDHSRQPRSARAEND